jgi:hypothetical protein
MMSILFHLSELTEGHSRKYKLRPLSKALLAKD